MQNSVHSGYYNIYRPPISLTPDYFKSTIYCTSTRLNTAYVIIPLVPGFTKDVIELVKTSPCKTFYLVASDIGILFVSDYYNTWDYIKHTMKRECKIFTKYLPENFCTGEFSADIIRTDNDNLSIYVPRSDLDTGTIDVCLTRHSCNNASPYACDVILNDTFKTRYFISENNAHKAEYLYQIRDTFDELHVPYITGNYGGWTYDEFIKKYPVMVTKTYANQFGSLEEYQYSKSRGVKVGNKYDPVRWWNKK